MDPHESQLARNRQNRDKWDRTADHRERVTRLLMSASPVGGSTCILGAGNCNDLDLIRLTSEKRALRRLMLVDLDRAAVEFGCAQQFGASSLPPSLQIAAPIDLTGWFHMPTPSLAQLRRPTLPADLPALPSVIMVPDWDVVASVCLISQLVEAATFVASDLTTGQASGPVSGTATQFALAARDQHLALMLHLIRPGGVGLLITDFVSSDTAAEMKTIADEAMPRAATNWLAAGNFFTGLNPHAIVKGLNEHKWGRVMPNSVQLAAPWRWSVGKRQFAVTTISFRRHPSSRSEVADRKRRDEVT